MKYVIFLTKSLNGMERKIPIIFPSTLNHIDVARALKDLDGIKSSKISSAGEVYVKVDKAHGESTTIGIKSKEGDEDIINMIDYGFGDKEMSKQIKEILEELKKK